MNNFLGKKYFKFNDEKKAEMFRCFKRKAGKTYLHEDVDGINTRFVSNINLHQYTPIKPIGGYILNIVELANGDKDVMVMLMRDYERFFDEHKKESGIQPYSICRQSVMDIFTMMLGTETPTVGLSISKDTCPAETKLDDYMQCTKVISSEYINIYLDDKYDFFTKYVNMKKYDEVLKEFHNKYNSIYNGCVTSLKELLKANNFEDEFNSAFNIIKLNSEIINNKLSIEQIDEINSKISTYKTKPISENDLLIQFKYDIDLNAIQREYIIIADPEMVYILAYI